MKCAILIMFNVIIFLGTSNPQILNRKVDVWIDNFVKNVMELEKLLFCCNTLLCLRILMFNLIIYV